MDEDHIFVPWEWLTSKPQSERSVASHSKEKTPHISSTGGQRTSPAPPVYPASPPPSHREPSPEYYNLRESPPSTPRKQEQANCPKNTTSSVQREQKIPQASPVFSFSPPPSNRQPSPEYYNLGEVPPEPPPRTLSNASHVDSHSRREPVPPLPRRTSASDQSSFNGLSPTDISNGTHKPPLPPSQRALVKKSHSTDEAPIPPPRRNAKTSASGDNRSTSGPPPTPHIRKLSVPVDADQHSLLAPPSPLPRNRRSASVDYLDKRELPLPPPIQNVYPTGERIKTDRRLGNQSHPKGHSAAISDDHTPENSQPLTSPKPTSPPTPTSAWSQFIPTSCAMTFEEVADPQKVTLPQLFMANTTCTDVDGVHSVAEESIILVKYTKSTSMVYGREQDGTKIQMSLNTPATLSPITDEGNQRRHMSAEELLSCKPHPIAVKVMQPFKQRDGTVERGTLLFLQTTGAAAAKGKPRKLTFQDYRGNRIMITAVCPGLFSSHPDDVKLFLAELVAKCNLPLNVLFEDGIYSSNIVRLDGVCQQDMLIAQVCSKRNGQPVGQDHELPNDSGLSFIRVALSDKKSEKVPPATISKLEATNASQFPTHTGETSSSALRGGYDADCTMPVVEENDAKAYLHMNDYEKMLRGRNHGVASSSTEQQPLWSDKSSHSGKLDKFAIPQTTPERPTDAGQPQTSDSERPASSDDDEDQEYLYVTGDISIQYTSEQRNIAYLKTLNEADILQLLEAMNMEVYKPTFQKEAVDGHLLSELTDEMLKSDLGVQSALHCLRLATVIKGYRSAKELLATRQAGN